MSDVISNEVQGAAVNDSAVSLTKVKAGEVIPCAPPAAKPGKNVVLRGGETIARITGSVHVSGEIVSIEPLLEVDGNDPAGAREIDFDGDVSITGCLREGRRVRATGNLWVEQAVEAVHIQAGNLYVGGGIIGGTSGIVTVDGCLTCKFLSGGTITAGRDITASGDLANTSIASMGRVSAPNGAIFGGSITANGGIQCQSLGNSNGTPTTIEAGIDSSLKSRIPAKAPEIEANRKHIRQVREKLEPLLKNERALNRQQRERATELLCEAADLEKRTDQDVLALAERARMSRAAASSEIAVTDSVYPGVTLRFPGAETVITSVLKGPLTLVPRGQGAATQIVLISANTGAEHPLQTHIVPDPAGALLDRLVGECRANSGVRAKCVNAFVSATKEFFQTMVRMPLNLAKPRFKEPGERIYKLYKISVVVQLAGGIEGCVWISFSERVAMVLAAALSGDSFTCLDDNCRDALGEIANMIVGSAKKRIAENPVTVSVPALQPTCELAYPAQSPIILLPFDTAAGRFIIEVAMAEARTNASGPIRTAA